MLNRYASRLILACSLLPACSHPECMENEIKIGKTCREVPSAKDAGSDASQPSLNADPHQDATDASSDAREDGATGTPTDAAQQTPPTAVADAGGSGDQGSGCDGGAGDGNCAPMQHVTGLAVGAYHACALLSSGQAQCWGRNDVGQLGIAAPGTSPPVVVPGLADVVEIAAGNTHSCARLADGSVHCWGGNNNGQLGDGTSISRADATTAVVGIANAKQIAAGGDNSCVVRSDGSTACWGVGYGSGAAQSSPVDVPGLTLPTRIALSPSHACALSFDGSVKCWGSNAAGALGNGQNGGSSDTPMAVLLGTTRAVDIAVGLGHSCAAVADGTVKCWGSDYYGQLGDGNGSMPLTGIPTPQTVSTISDARSVGAGVGFSCAVRADGTASCWGKGGTLGDGTMDVRTTPRAVASLEGVVELRTGCDDFSCARLSNDAVRCWGAINSDGQLGDGTTSDPLVPVQVKLIR